MAQCHLVKIALEKIQRYFGISRSTLGQSITTVTGENACSTRGALVNLGGN